MNIETLRKLASDCSYAWDMCEAGTAELLGSGSFGAAYRLRDGTVFKVGECIDGTALWIMHAAKVYRDTGKPAEYAPKVYAFEVLESGKWWARMEWVTSANARSGRDAWCCAAPDHMQAYLKDWGDSMELATYAGEYYYPDSHGGNWGYTRDGREVCFDPFAGEQDVACETVLPRPKVLPKHRAVRHAGPTLGRWARG